MRWDLYDTIAAAGLLLICVGAWLVWPPAALGIAGAALLWFGLRGGGR